MSYKTSIFGLILGAVAISAVGYCVSSTIRSNALNNPVKSPIVRTPYDPIVLGKNIAFFDTRVKADPIAAWDNAKLASLYLQRCRETGDIADAALAEKFARNSLKIRKSNNANGFDTLAQCLSTQHRFNEALDAVNHALSIDPTDPQAIRLKVEISIEIGDYSASEQALKLAGPEEDSSLKTLRARLLDIHGQPELALGLLKQAQGMADSNRDLPSENVAWYHVRVGDQLVNLGQAPSAITSYKEALVLFPNDYKAMFGMARAEAKLKDWKDCIRWAKNASEIIPSPESLALLGDAYLAIGDSANANDQFATVEAIGKIARSQGTTYDRQRALYLADHSKLLPEAVQLASNELKNRKDIYSYDTLSWCAFKNGNRQLAEENLVYALATGSKDPRILEHASQIRAH